MALWNGKDIAYRKVEIKGLDMEEPTAMLVHHLCYAIAQAMRGAAAELETVDTVGIACEDGLALRRMPASDSWMLYVRAVGRAPERGPFPAEFTACPVLEVGPSGVNERRV
jgi:hypothetical protein